MRKRWQMWIPWLGLSGASVLGLGAILALTNTAGQLPESSSRSAPSSPGQSSAAPATNGDSQVLALGLQSPEQRADELAAIAAAEASPEQARARYLLATDLIAQGRGGQALPLLETLADDYPILAANSRVKEGVAQAASGNPELARQAWNAVLQDYPEQPATADALFRLGQAQPEYWQQLIEQFPAHPRSVEVAYQQLTATPTPSNEKALLLVMTRHGIYHPDLLPLVDRLVETYGEQLTPAEWQAVGFAYWERQSYQAAGAAYQKAPATPQTRYRAARGLEIGERRTEAIAAYQALASQFPEAPETATGLLKLADLVDLETALRLLDQVIQQFPERAGEALHERALVLEALDSPQAATQARDRLLREYSASDAAAELRARFARNAGAAGNWSGALQWTDDLLQANGGADIAAEIGFWAGKWALRAGQSNNAVKYFEQVIQSHPESYFAWRSAVALGWEVGDFQTVRSLQPAVVLPAQRSPLPAGSETLQELYRLGQDRDAWATWQVEFSTPQAPTVEEQFTDGVLRLGVGDNLDGIFMISSLQWRDTPVDQASYQAIQQHPAYWQTLYPFPFADSITQWAGQRRLNPLLVTALIRQESRFEPQIRSVAGAVGLMQVLPETADWIQIKTGLSAYDLTIPDDNIQLGTWYLDYTHQEYDNHSLYAVASYNAGPGNVADWIARGNYRDVDEFVDAIPFPETKNYVKAVFGGYWNYLRLYDPVVKQRFQKAQRNSSS